MHLITPCNSVILQTLRFRLEKLKSSMFWTGSKYSLSPGTLQLIRRRVNNIPTSSVTDAWIRHNEVVSRPPPLFASSSTSPHLGWPDSFTCVWFFQFSFSFLPCFCSFWAGSVADFLLFHFPEPLFAFLLWPPALLPTSALLSFNLFISSRWNGFLKIILS